MTFLAYLENLIRQLEQQPTPRPTPTSKPTPTPSPDPIPTPPDCLTPTPTPCQRPSYPTDCPTYWTRDNADISTLDPPTCELPYMPPQTQSTGIPFSG
ncbi:MAG: hypothetical protein SNJ68_07765 [Cyanobacteriota bacterium]